MCVCTSICRYNVLCNFLFPVSYQVILGALIYMYGIVSWLTFFNKATEVSAHLFF